MLVAGDFRSDLNALLQAVKDARPFALTRFHDGEYAVCEGRGYKARSPWSSTSRAWLRPQLLEALQTMEPGLVLGVSPSCCHPAAARYYSRNVKQHPATFATLFQNANYSPAFLALREMPHVLVGSSDAAQVRVPGNAVEDSWDLDSVVEQLVGVDKPIFVAAGPAACVIVTKLWQRYKRVPVIDVGALFDDRTRDYHSPTNKLRTHVCGWSRVLHIPASEPERTDSFVQRPTPRERAMMGKRGRP